MLIDMLEYKTYNKNDLIIKEGEVGDYLYIIEEGEVECYKNVIS